MSLPDIDRIAELRFLRHLYNQPDQRLRTEHLEGTTASLSLSPSIVATLRERSPALVQVEGDWLVLTPAGEEFYRDQFTSLMSRSE